jgi:uncharacterized protein YgiM (DUF1202 family)
MNGLYQRALQIYRQKNTLRLVSKEEPDGAMEEIPAEERENILREIDHILAKNRVSVDMRVPKGGKRGIGLPIIVNLIILTAVAATVFLFTRTLNGEERQLASGARAIKGAESQVVQALQQESAAQLGQKDQEIVAFRKKLDEASAERERLQNQTAETIRKREEELSAEMASSLEAERQRLQSSGLSSDTQDARLRAYEDKLKAETARQAEAFRKKAEDEAAANEAAVNGLIAGYQRNLSQAQGERAHLEQQYQSQEAELKSRYEKDSKALQEEKSQAVSDLDRLQELQRQENLVMGRILSGYDDINARIKAGDNEGALKDISDLRDSLDREPARSLAAIQNRRPVELFILGSLEELVRYHIERDSGDTAALVDTKTRIAALREKAAQAEKRYLDKDLPAARELYLSALAEIPEARNSYDRLDSMALEERQAQLEASRRSEQSFVAQGSALFQSASWQATLERYRQALGLLLDDQAGAASLVAQVAEAGYRLGAQQDAAKRAILPNRIDLMKQELMSRPDETGSAQSPDFASLLQAKLLLWQIIGTDPIKSKYPELYDTMQKYFDTFASQQRQAGRDEALGEVLALTESLQKGQAKAPPTPASDRDSMVRLLDGLERLMKE